MAVGLLTAYYILSILDKKKQNPPVSISTGDRFLVGGIVFIILVTVSTVYLKKPKDVPSSTQYDNKKTSIVTKMQEEYEKLKKSKFFEERFDGNLDDWTPPFMTSGDVSQVQYASLPDRGGLNVRLTPVEGQSPSAYFINELDTYTDVEVEMSVKNNDENLNTISLVCRHNDNGW